MIAWALIVGIDKHPDDAELTALHGAVADAADFAEWVLHPDGGGVAPERLFFWSHPKPADEVTGPLLEAFLRNPTPWPLPRNPGRSRPPDMGRAPASGEILAATEQLNSSATLANGPQRAYVLFAGHGVQVQDGALPETCFLAGDYATGAGLVPCGQLGFSLQSNGFAEVLMFLDCCRTPVSSRTPVPNLFPKGGGGTIRRALASAAEAGKTSYEFPEEPPKRGAFTRALTEGLRSKRDAAGVLTYEALSEHVRSRVPTLLGGGRSQFPQFASDPPNPNPPLVVLSGPVIEVAPAAIVADLRALPVGTEVRLLDADANPIGDPLVAGPDPIRVRQPVGTIYGLVSANPPRSRYFKHDGPGDTRVSL